MIYTIKQLCRGGLIALGLMRGFFLYAYTPEPEQEQLLLTLQEKVDELAVSDASQLRPLHDQVKIIVAKKQADVSYPERKKYILLELQAYIFDEYLKVGAGADLEKENEPASEKIIVPDVEQDVEEDVEEGEESVIEKPVEPVVDRNDDSVLDLISDDSLHKFVTRTIGFKNQYYIPTDLVMLFPTPTMALSVSDDLSYMMISKTALNPLQDLSSEFESVFNYPMLINSAWRSFEFQRDGFTQECRDSLICAEPGYSEHQSGLSIDVNGMFGDQYIRMSENAHRFGFHQSYQNGIEIDGYNEEKRHRRYLGVDFATELFEKEITFTQWVREKEEK